MTVRLYFHAVAQVAPIKALTTREWEALARAFGEMEGSGAVELPEPELPGGPKSRISDVHHALDRLAEQIDLYVRDQLRRAGLLPQEWIVRATPRVTHELSVRLFEDWNWNGAWPDTEWDVMVRLFGPRSLAKGTVGGSDAPSAPTLSEQHGDADRCGKTHGDREGLSIRWTCSLPRDHEGPCGQARKG